EALGRAIERSRRPPQLALVDRAEDDPIAVAHHAAGRPIVRPCDPLELPRHHPLLPDRDAGNVETGAKDAVIGRVVERAPVVIAPGEIGAVARDAQPAEQPPAWIDHVNAARAGAIDLPFL